MDIKELQKNWDAFGKIDPLWAIVCNPPKKGNKWQIEEFFEFGVKEIDAVMKYIESLSLALPRRKALDFGCGVGRLTQALANYFDEVYGVDIAPSMIELARKFNRRPDKCRYYLNETDNLQLFPENSFDFVYSNITLQHMEPRYAKNYIKEFLRILTPQGLLIFQQPSGPILKNRNPRGRLLKRLIKPIAPERLWNLYYRLRRRILNQPWMEIYEIKKEEVVSLLEAQRAKIMDIVESEDTCPGRISVRYCVTKL